MSEYWSTVLLDEWAVQASLERQLNLPISVVASADALIQAKGQIGFIDLFTLPLYEAAADAMPGKSYVFAGTMLACTDCAISFAYRSSILYRSVLSQSCVMASAVRYAEGSRRRPAAHRQNSHHGTEHGRGYFG